MGEELDLQNLYICFTSHTNGIHILISLFYLSSAHVARNLSQYTCGDNSVKT